MIRLDNTNRDPYRLGLVSLGAGLALAIFVTIISTISFGTKSYTAHMAHTAGLRAGEDVQVAGVHVGQVKSIELDGDDVLVHFTLDSGIKLGRDTTAETKVATLLGTHYLAVDPKGTGELPGGSIPLSQTSVPYNLQDVIDKGTGALEKIDPKLIAQALSTMSDTAEATHEEFGPALRGIARVGEVVATRTNQGGALLEAARGLSAQLSDSTSDLLDLMQQSNLVLKEIRVRRAAIHDLLVDATALAGSIRSIITQTQGDLDVALADVEKVLTMLRGEDKTLKRALEVMAPSARYLANVTGNGPWASISVPNAQPDGVICHMEGTC